MPRKQRKSKRTIAAKKSQSDPPGRGTISQLPIEILIKIFSFFSSKELLSLEQVSHRWKAVISESIWKQKRTISEDDVDAPNAPLVLQLENFVRYVSRLRRIDSYFVPKFDAIFNSIETDRQVIFRIFQCLCRLAIELRAKYVNGELSFHCELICFLNGMEEIVEICQKGELSAFVENLQQDNLGYVRRFHERWLMLCVFHPNGYDSRQFEAIRCFFEKCSKTVIIPLWKIENAKEESAGVRMLLDCELDLSKVGHIVFERLESERVVKFFNHRVENDPRRGEEKMMIFDVLRKLAADVRLEAKRIVVHCLPTEISYTITFKDGVFTKEEFVDIVKAMNTFSERDPSLLRWKGIIAGWRASDRIEDITVGLAVPRFANVIFREAVKPPQQRDPLLNVMLLFTEIFPSLCRSVHITESCDQLLDLLPHLYRDEHVLCELKELRVQVLTSFVYFDDDEQVPFPDTSVRPSRLWRTLVPASGFEQLRSLSFDLSRISDNVRKKCPALPTRKAPLPHLDHLVAKGCVDLPHLLSILQHAPRLRHLELKLAIDHPPKTRRERFQWTKDLLNGIAETKELVSLSITIRAGNQEEYDPSHQLWLDTWLDGVTTRGRKEYMVEPPPRKVKPKLRKDVINALLALPMLQYLELKFNLFMCYPRTSMALLYSDEHLLLAKHPQLRYVLLNDVNWRGKPKWRLSELERLIRRSQPGCSSADSDSSDGVEEATEDCDSKSSSDSELNSSDEFDDDDF